MNVTKQAQIDVLIFCLVFYRGGVEVSRVEVGESRSVESEKVSPILANCSCSVVQECQNRCTMCSVIDNSYYVHIRLI